MFLTLLAQAEPDVNQIAQAVDLFDFTKITIAAVVIGLGFLVNRAALATLDRMGEGQAKRRLLFKKVQSFTRLGIFVVCGYLLVMTFFGGDGDNKALIGLQVDPIWCECNYTIPESCGLLNIRASSDYFCFVLVLQLELVLEPLDNM